jgi:hypothetical protein
MKRSVIALWEICLVLTNERALRGVCSTLIGGCSSRSLREVRCRSGHFVVRLPRSERDEERLSHSSARCESSDHSV